MNIHWWYVTTFSSAVFVLNLFVQPGTLLAAGSIEAMVISVTDQSDLTVEAVRVRTYRAAQNQSAVIVWPQVNSAGWEVLLPNDHWTKPALDQPDKLHLLANSRSITQTSGGAAAALRTTLVEQLRGRVIFRTTGSEILTPHNGFLLSNRPTVRRVLSDEGLPEQTVVISQRNQEQLKIRFNANQQSMRWHEIPGLPDSLKNGLPPGEYQLSIEGSDDTITFTIVEDSVREFVEAQLELLKVELSGEEVESKDLNTLLREMSIATLLDQPQIANHLGQKNSVEFLSDALDLLDSVPPAELTEHLKRIQQTLASRLQGTLEVNSNTIAPTGISQIDAARELLFEGKWKEALAQLDAPELQASDRSQGLTLLYRATILAEFSPTQSVDIASLFTQAIKLLAKASPEDQYRAHNNFAGFLLNHTVDGVYSHSMQMITGGKNSLFSALYHWKLAQYHFQKSSELAKEVAPAELAAVNLNTARLYLVLADIVRTLDDLIGTPHTLETAEKLASQKAIDYLKEVARISSANHVDPMIVAASHELSAELSFKANRLEDVRAHAFAAQHHYLESGSLAGVESVQRLLGLTALKANETSQAIHHFKRSHLVTEFLRAQIPADKYGKSQAGFYARRAFVTDQLAELLAIHGQPEEALRFVEFAKARSLSDTLIAAHISTDLTRGGDLQLDDLLENWSIDQAGLIYHLGPQRVHVFLVDTSGKVRVAAIRDQSGEIVSPQQFIMRVQSVLHLLEGESSRMRAQLQANAGFDSSWQTELAILYQMLIPTEFRHAIANAKQVVIVPHHILHYLPFAALVTQPDLTARGAFEIPRPEFLIDAEFDLLYAPSLATWVILGEEKHTDIDLVNAVGLQQFANAHPLPGVADELAHLQKAFGKRVRHVIKDQNANKKTLQHLLSQPGLLLLATHGVNDLDQPLNSHLLCYSENEKLTASEIFESPVNSDIVILSACYSGLADRSPLPGDDLFGLKRALLHQGAHVVVSGHWDVFDGTAPLLLKEVFERLASNDPASAALATSQRNFLNNLRKSEKTELHLHPHFWAMYTVAGNDL